MKRYCLIVLLTSIMYGCLDRSIDNRKIKIYNKSNEIIYFFISKNDEFAEPYLDYSEETINSDDIVKQDTFAYYTDNPINWDDFIKKCKEGQMRLFITEKDSVNKYGLQTVISKGIYTKKYYIDINYLENTGWSIEYRNK